MDEINRTCLTEFLIVGFSDFTRLQVPLFATLVLIYLITLIANFLIMSIIYSDSRLHTPMYFFLTNLAFLDISYTSVTIPRMLANFFQEASCISLIGCFLQLYCFLWFLCTEFNLLAVMAYDRYVAICNPLLYTVLMSKTTCQKLAAGSWTFSILETIPHAVLLSQLSFSGSRRLNHFFCDLPVLLMLSSNNAHTMELATFVLGALFAVSTLLLVLLSYINIISAILNIRSTEGRQKAFSTCASHLTVVIVFYGALFMMYLTPMSRMPADKSKIFSLFYIVFTPLCNPIIYSLKNSEFKSALQKGKQRRRC
ncbi:olfactory receptor 8U9-like [Ambystoma mexicanum]|uniref:olfactory receptor 8U9-like n=1 Tax=Ambystoma mexicanum TaxID=8296 RepID=UPI0037E8B423